jgi:nucleoid-associated protein YgaU
MPDRVTLAELNVSDALTVVLEDVDLPFGREGATAAFESGGKLIKERIDLPGRTQPIFHILAAPERPLTMRGTFRDSLAQRAGHARAMRAQLYKLYRRANLLKLTWAGDERVVLLDEPKFGEESQHAISWELTFEVALGPDDTAAADAPAQTTTSGQGDLVQALTAQLAARRAQMAALALARAPKTSVLDAFDQATAALDTVAREARALEAATGALTGPIRRVLGVAHQAQGLVTTLRGQLRTVVTRTDLLAQDAAALTAWSVASFGLESDLLDADILLQALLAATRRRLYRATRLYRVRPGDTLEDIARRALGSAARVAALGLRPEDLVPGRYIRIPEAS